MTEGSHLIKNTQVDPHWFSDKNLENLRWCREQICIPDDASGYLCQLRGKDEPNFPEYGKQSKTQRKLSTFSKATLVVTKTTGEQRIFGGPAASIRDDGEFKFRVDLPSQTPALSFSFRRLIAEGDMLDYHVTLHGNTTIESVNVHNRLSLSNAQPPVEIPKQHQAAAKEGRLVAVTIRYGETPARERYLNSVMLIHGDHGGLHSRWDSDDQMIAAIPPNSVFDNFDYVVHALYHERNVSFTFFREIEAESLQWFGANFDGVLAYWYNIMQHALRHGPFYFYKMQPKWNPVLREHFANWFNVKIPPPLPPWLG